MQTSENLNELATALAKAQGQMGGAAKASENPYFKSKYADLGSVIAAAKEPLAENGLSYVQFPFSYNGEVGVTTRLMHSSGQWMESSFSIPATKPEAHLYGSIITYCRRFSLQSALGIPAEDDDGNAATQAAKAPISQEQVFSIKAMLELTKTEEHKFAKAYNIGVIEDMTTDQFKHAIPLLEKKRLNMQEES
jgi:hypothetical protein